MNIIKFKFFIDYFNQFWKISLYRKKLFYYVLVRIVDAYNKIDNTLLIPSVVLKWYIYNILSDEHKLFDLRLKCPINVL